jgi:predicted Zn-dependent protease
VPAGPAGAPDDLAAKSRLGKELMAAGRYREAVSAYRELVAASPRNPGLLLNLGMALHLAGQSEEAVPLLQTAIRLQPDLLPATLFLGAANLRLGRPEAAVTPLQSAVRLQPDNRDARSMLADALLGLDRPAEALPHLRRLCRLVPADPTTWFNLGKAYEELAGRAFTALLESDPESPLGLALVADARLKQERRNAAFQLYRQALARGATLRGLHAAIASIYRSAGHPEWAAIEEQKEKRLPPPDCARDALECAFAAGKYDEVTAAAAKSATPAARYWSVRAYNELAVQAFSRLAALPPSVESHQWSAQMHREEGRYLESAGEWRKAMALAPDDAGLKLELAVTLRLARDFAGAQKILEELVRASPDAPEANGLLGDVLLAREQPERAIPFLEKAVRLSPEPPPAHGALGRAYAQVGRPADAIPHLERALPADADGSLRYQLARCYQATGQAAKAAAALKDYEQLKKASALEAETAGTGAPITPP